MMKKSKIKTYLFFVIILFAFVLYFSLKDNFFDIIETLSRVNIIYLFIGIIFVFLSKYFIAITTYYLAKKEQKKVSMIKMLEICLIYPFFAGITPSSVGGESFEVFYLKQTGLPYGKATNISIQKFILYQISLIIVNAIAVILNLFTKIVPNSSFVETTVILNFIVNGVILSFCFLLVYNKKINHFVMKKGLAFLHKIKIIKNIDKTKEKLDSYLDNFNEGVDKLRKDKKLFIKLIGINVISIIFLYLAAWPIASSMEINNISALNLFILSTYAKMMCILIITPGNSGGAEYCFIYLFTGLIEESNIIAYMLMWRVATYYIPLVVGGIIAITWGRGKKKNEENDSVQS